VGVHGEAKPDVCPMYHMQKGINYLSCYAKQPNSLQRLVGPIWLHRCLLIYLVSHSDFFSVTADDFRCKYGFFCKSLCPIILFICTEIYYFGKYCIFIFDERSYLSYLFVATVIL